ncbi:TMEM165/GDT1 family protein [Candidatus Moduliflexota bacterium]|jgi:putative Ca2+/H+ antiporter (TMEM165/GDT1 family)
MDYKTLFTVFSAVFIAELGDKTQLATLLFAADKEVGKLTVFLGAAAALLLTTAIGVAAGGVISRYLGAKVLHTVAGIGFIAIGIWTLARS